MLNKAILMGRLTRDPELKKTNSGKAVAGYTLAVERNYGKDKEKEVDFFDIVSWEKQAEFVTNYFAKGQMMCVEGRLQQRSWTDENNQKRYVVEVVTESVYFAGESKKNTDNAAADGEYVPTDYSTGNAYVPQDNGYTSHGGGYAPQNNGYTQQNGSFAPQGNGNMPPNGGYVQPPFGGGYDPQSPDIDFTLPTGVGQAAANADVFDPYAA